MLLTVDVIIVLSLIVAIVSLSLLPSTVEFEYIA